MNLLLENISKSYSANVVFNNISYCFQENGKYIIKAPNGVGKTTLLELISTELSCDKGKINFNKRPVRAYDVSYLSARTNGLFPRLTGEENLKSLLGARLFSQKSKFNEEKIKNHFKNNSTFKKALSTSFDSSSAGMKKLLMLYICFLKDSPIYILDEPFNYLDPENKEFIIETINLFLKDKIIILVTHQEENLENFQTLNLSQDKLC